MKFVNQLKKNCHWNRCGHGDGLKNRRKRFDSSQWHQNKMARSYIGYYTRLSTGIKEFDSPTSRQNLDRSYQP